MDHQVATVAAARTAIERNAMFGYDLKFVINQLRDAGRKARLALGRRRPGNGRFG
jgi:hypothetical protein